MQDILVVVDMQKDFIDGSLGTREAAAIVPAVVKKVKSFSGPVYFTKDTHEPDYLDTQEGRLLPVPHCIRGTEGWAIHPSLRPYAEGHTVEKPTFGSRELGRLLSEADRESPVRRITLVGLCTDVCVISNALLLKAVLPEAEIVVDAACCAGVTPEQHKTALRAMAACQVRIVGEDLT